MVVRVRDSEGEWAEVFMEAIAAAGDKEQSMMVMVKVEGGKC